ncbi:hypothetical protein JCM17843_07600 [Kordiimonadales bacterium JCM 17843]|nr:hypothetical protein JCM17843_07600 [Kordiimonadales bacterium JCM 17843]
MDLGIPPALDQSLWTVLIAILANLTLCSSSRISRFFSRPLVLAGRMINMIERRYNHPSVNEGARRIDSISIAVFLLIFGFLCGLGLSLLLQQIPFGWIIDAMLIAAVLGLRPMLERMRLITRSLESSLEEGRATITLITGRDTANLDKHGLSAAAIESIAMGFSQGFIAPLLWYALGGLPALFAFKLIDTASIMIDERSDHARSFGFALRYGSAIFLAPAIFLSLPFLFLGSLITRGTGLARGLHMACARKRYAWPTFSLSVALFSGFLGTRLGGPVCIGSYQRTGDIFGEDMPSPSISSINQAHKLAARSA